MDPVMEPFVSVAVTDTVTATATKSLKVPLSTISQTPIVRIRIMCSSPLLLVLRSLASKIESPSNRDARNV